MNATQPKVEAASRMVPTPSGARFWPRERYMAWLAWGLLGFVIGTLFKLVARRHGRGGWFAGICVGVAGALTGGWVAGAAWNRGVLNVSTANLVGAVIGAIVLLAIYWYRLRHRRPGYANPNAM